MLSSTVNNISETRSTVLHTTTLLPLLASNYEYLTNKHFWTYRLRIPSVFSHFRSNWCLIEKQQKGVSFSERNVYMDLVFKVMQICTQ